MMRKHTYELTFLLDLGRGTRILVPLAVGIVLLGAFVLGPTLCDRTTGVAMNGPDRSALVQSGGFHGSGATPWVRKQSTVARDSMAAVATAPDGHTTRSSTSRPARSSPATPAARWH